MAAKNMTAARNTPLVAAVPKMFFPFLVIVPGMIAAALATHAGQGLPHPAGPISRPTICQGRRRREKRQSANADAAGRVQPR